MKQGNSNDNLIKKFSQNIKKTKIKTIRLLRSFAKKIRKTNLLHVNKKASKTRQGYRWNGLLNFVTVIFACASILMLFFASYPFSASYNVIIETERIQFKNFTDNNFYFRSASLNDYFKSNNNIKNFNGRISVNSGVSIEIERIAHGAVCLTFETTDEKTKSIGQIYGGRNDTLLGSAGKFVKVFLRNIEQRIKKGRTISYYIDGEILGLGKIILKNNNAISIPLLKSGEVKMIRETLFMRNAEYVARTEKLNMGDGLKFEYGKDTNKSLGRAFGFVTINEKPGMSAVYRIKADKAKIIKPGPIDKKSGYYISVSIVDIFLNDRIFQVISIIIPIIASFIGFYRTFITSGKD